MPDAPAPSPSAPSVVSYSVAPLGTPRILMPDTATVTRLRTGLSTNAASATRFKAFVDSQLAGTDNYAFKPWFAALMSQLSGNTAYCNYAVSRTDAGVAAEEALIARGNAPTVASDDYLDIGDIIGGMAMVYDWCRPQTTAAQRTRWLDYGNAAVYNVWNPTLAKWGATSRPWTGWAVDDPSNNYYYSFLRATMMLGLASLGENPQAQAWLDKFRGTKIAGQLVPAFNSDLAGGGSREGTGYGVAMKGLFDLYYFWEKSTGERMADFTPHTLASLGKMLHDIVPTLDQISPTGDHSRDSKALLFDYHREYILILSRLYPADAMSGVARSLLAQSSVPQMTQGFERWIDFVYDGSDIAAQPLSRLPTARWGAGTGQFSVRSAWATDAAYLNLICGAYTQSHAHQDQGSFVLFKGRWLAMDENLDSASGLSQEVPVHNLVRVETTSGSVIRQSVDTSCQMRALADTTAYAYAFADVTPTYAPSGAVSNMQRELVFVKPGVVVVLDRVSTVGSGARRVWTMNLPVAPVVSGTTFTMTSGSNRLDVYRLAPTGLSTQVLSWPSLDSDKTGGSRVDVVDASGSSSVFLHVLGADGAVSSAVRSDAAGQTGALIRMPSGATATVRFNTVGSGGTIELRDAANALISSSALPAGVTAPPIFAN